MAAINPIISISGVNGLDNSNTRLSDWMKHNIQVMLSIGDTLRLKDTVMLKVKGF